MKQDNLLVITGSPQFYDESSTVSIIWSVVFCLLPAAGWGVYSFGYPALAVLAVSIGTSLAFEGLIAAAFRRGQGAMPGVGRDIGAKGGHSLVIDAGEFGDDRVGRVHPAQDRPDG